MAMVMAAGGGFALLFCYPLLPHLNAPTAFADWDIWLGTEVAAVRSLVQFHQLPMWNPYECGGNPLLGNPQSSFLTPWFLLILFFGPAAGLYLSIIIHSVVAWT